MANAVTDFYDGLSAEYSDNMGWDWKPAVRREGVALSKFITETLGSSASQTILDCACGIGTQAIGLALQGHKVHATDLSPASIECAIVEAGGFGVTMDFSVADFCDLGASVNNRFNVVLACDNSISHCLNNDMLDLALTSMKARLNPNGMLVLSVRDYDSLIQDLPRFNSQHVQDRPDGRRIVFQVWDWCEDGTYRAHQFLARESGGEYGLKHFETTLRALCKSDLMDALNRVGFSDAQWHLPKTSGYYQPIVTARNS